ncbi:WecB/TagA/CpsF family glycosyltransferase [bacterium]|nr:WecB/TagA/CpsF family glycosyltransferase [bacterium]
MTFKLMNIDIEEWTIEDLHHCIEKSISKGSAIEIFNVNVHAMNLMYRDAEFFELFRSCDYIFCDGEGVRIAANFRGAKIPYKITYADWMNDFLPFCEKSSYKLFFLGSNEETLGQAVKQVKMDYPKIDIVGSLNGFECYDTIKTKLESCKPDIIIVGMGMPLQEKIIRRLKVDGLCGVYLSGGAVFDYVSKSVERAPTWMVSMKLEWLFRFLLDPKRLFLRYFIGNPLFYFRLFCNKSP